MSIESRMEEFEKVSHKKEVTNVKERMEGFETIDKDKKIETKEKVSTLPYGVKRFKVCTACDEMMEISEFKTHEVVYICKACGQKMTLTVGSL